MPHDFDMDLLIDACTTYGIQTEIADWTDHAIAWDTYDAVLLRSPWSYAENLESFLSWCARVDAVTWLFNPLPVIGWGLDKSYLGDLAARGVPIVPTEYLHPGAHIEASLQAVLAAHPQCDELVVKPTVGAYSQNVGRYTRPQMAQAVAHAETIFAQGRSVIVQPYLSSIDELGETDMIYFDGRYSHAIRKAPLLMPDGTVNVPSTDTRSARIASEAEKDVGDRALAAVMQIFGLSQPLLYARVDLIRDQTGKPVVLEMEISEPSLSLPFAPKSPERFAAAIANRLGLRSARSTTK